MGTAPFEALLAKANQRGAQEFDVLCRFKGLRDPLTGKRTGTLRARYLGVPQPDHDTLRVSTNLDAGFLPAAEATALYFQRWGVETDFRRLQGPDHLPVVLSRKPQTVRQEIVLRLLAHYAVRHVQALAHSFCPQPSPKLGDPLSEVGRHQICAKPGRHYPRIGRKYQKGKRNKGNRTAQGQRWRRRKHNPSDTQAHQT